MAQTQGRKQTPAGARARLTGVLMGRPPPARAAPTGTATARTRLGTVVTV
jgi:hypothetical protein